MTREEAVGIIAEALRGFSSITPDSSGKMVLNTSATLLGTEDCNITKVAGTAVDVNSGNKSAGTMRFVIATDQPAFTAAGLMSMKIDQTTPGTTNGIVINNGNVGGFTTLVQSTVVMSAAGAYATGDYMGTTTSPQSFASAVRTSGGTGIIKSLLISDKIVTANVAMELWIINQTFTAPTDNAAWDLSDADMLFVQAIIPITTTGWYASSAGQVYFDSTLSIPIKVSTGTSLFYALVARGTTPSFTSSDLTITLGVLQD